MMIQEIPPLLGVRKPELIRGDEEQFIKTFRDEGFRLQN